MITLAQFLEKLATFDVAAIVPEYQLAPWRDLVMPYEDKAKLVFLALNVASDYWQLGVSTEARAVAAKRRAETAERRAYALEVELRQTQQSQPLNGILQGELDSIQVSSARGPGVGVDGFTPAAMHALMRMNSVDGVNFKVKSAITQYESILQLTFNVPEKFKIAHFHGKLTGKVLEAVELAMAGSKFEDYGSFNAYISLVKSTQPAEKSETEYAHELKNLKYVRGAMPARDFVSKFRQTASGAGYRALSELAMQFYLVVTAGNSPLAADVAFASLRKGYRFDKMVEHFLVHEGGATGVAAELVPDPDAMDVGAIRQWAAAHQGRALTDIKCYNCKGYGHKAADCPSPPRSSSGNASRA
ncbi:hypothetical protein H9P43_002398 [Blastocladiella emersonii ATCC 22665]|nr:hypothetical protein H9P43_002398 [Blastocladiella emersonii ATCC 22665]